MASRPKNRRNAEHEETIVLTRKGILEGKPCCPDGCMIALSGLERPDIEDIWVGYHFVDILYTGETDWDSFQFDRSREGATEQFDKDPNNLRQYLPWLEGSAIGLRPRTPAQSLGYEKKQQGKVSGSGTQDPNAFRSRGSRVFG